MNAILKLGRYLFAIPMLIFGILHFMNANTWGGMVPDFIPGGAFWVYLTGAGFILAAISIVIRKYDQLACLLLGIMLLIFAFSVHFGNALEGDMTQFLKDVALAGGAFAYGLLASPPPSDEL